jgi:hypothetical protein
VRYRTESTDVVHVLPGLWKSVLLRIAKDGFDAYVLCMFERVVFFKRSVAPGSTAWGVPSGSLSC